jgi:hypothetical protein
VPLITIASTSSSTLPTACVQRAIEDLAAPAFGCLVVTPTPGTQSVGVLLQDLVRATGAPIPPNWGPLTGGMVSATTELLRHARVRDVYVLRAHRLAPKGWSQLIDLAIQAPCRLWLVIHQERPSRAQLRLLQRYPVHWHRPSRREGNHRTLQPRAFALLDPVSQRAPR